MYKIIIGQLLETMGFNYTKNMDPAATYFVIAGDTTDESSAKVKTANEYDASSQCVLIAKL